MKDEEKDIIRLLNQRDKRAVSMLYDRYAASLYGIVLQIVRSEPVAQDVIQEVFVKAWQNGSSYDFRKGTLFTWLLNIARNKAIDKTRSANFRRSAKTQPLHPELHDSERLSVENNPDHIGLRKLVTGLEDKYRAVIELAYFQGFTQQEVAEYLGIPLGTVKSRARIALRELRKTFEEHGIALLWIILQCHI